MTVIFCIKQSFGIKKTWRLNSSPMYILFQAFFSKSEIIGQILVHIGNKPHICSECGKTFASKGNIISYVKIHLDDKGCQFKMQKKRLRLLDTWIYLLKIKTRTHFLAIQKTYWPTFETGGKMFKNTISWMPGCK